MEDRYFNTRVIVDSKKKRRYREASFIPTLEKTADDTYVIATIEDRLDTLAYKYYRNSLYWWVIATANPDIRFDSMYIEPGTQLRIPSVNTISDLSRIIKDQNKNK
jgi:hypothetical protein